MGRGVRRRARRLLGAALTGCAVAALTLGCSQTKASAPETESRVFEEGRSELQQLLVQYDPAATYQLFPVYRDLAAALAPETRLVIAIPNAASLRSAEALFTAAGFAKTRCRFVPCDASLSPWARDRMIAIRHPSGPVFFHPNPSPREVDKDTDLTVAPRMATLLGGKVATGLTLEGGNVLAGAGHLFIGGNVLRDNERYFHADLREILRRIFGRTPVLLGHSRGVPHHHLDLYLTATGPGTVLLGDPGAAADLLDEMTADGMLDSLGTGIKLFSAAGQRKFLPKYEGIRQELERLGLKVARVPILHGETCILTWNNAVIERRGTTRHAFIPVYGLPRFDQIAVECYERLGCRVHRIDASRIIALGGSVRCVTNVVGWRNVKL